MLMHVDLKDGKTDVEYQSLSWSSRAASLLTALET